jgi:hypothetical protein
MAFCRWLFAQMAIVYTNLGLIKYFQLTGKLLYENMIFALCICFTKAPPKASTFFKILS